MKLIIDIPEGTYIHLHNGGNIGASLLIENAIKNGTPLADIRTEISHKIKLCSDIKMSYGMEVTLAIIDKYRGEQNEIDN